MALIEAVIVGDGLIELPAVFESSSNTDIVPLGFEATNIVGDLSKTIEFKGNLLYFVDSPYDFILSVTLKRWNNILKFEKSINVNYLNPSKKNLIVLKKFQRSKIEMTSVGNVLALQ